jgi:catechol 2,3-dioxygenase-like lactoylglutathione lyase family enzyme
VLVAEGSDWFWWYGDDHSSAHDLEFDDLFRRHLRNVYKLLEKPIPDELFVSNITVGAPLPAQTDPAGLITPTLDGEETSYFEWLGAGVLEIRASVGAMHQIDHKAPVLTLVQFGFDREHLYVRLDAGRRLVELLSEGYEFSLKFLRPDGVRFSVRQDFGRLTGRFWDRRPEPPHWVERGPGAAAVAAGRLIEIAVPLTDLGVAPGDPLAFFVAVYDPEGHELERHPPNRPIDAEVPNERFAGRNWAV